MASAGGQKAPEVQAGGQGPAFQNLVKQQPRQFGRLGHSARPQTTQAGRAGPARVQASDGKMIADGGSHPGAVVNHAPAACRQGQLRLQNGAAGGGRLAVRAVPLVGGPRPNFAGLRTGNQAQGAGNGKSQHKISLQNQHFAFDGLKAVGGQVQIGPEPGSSGGNFQGGMGGGGVQKAPVAGKKGQGGLQKARYIQPAGRTEQQASKILLRGPGQRRGRQDLQNS